MHELTVHITRRCYFNCRQCRRGPREAPATAAERRIAVRAAARRRPRRLRLAGGEPLLLDDLARLVRSAKEEGAGEVVLDTTAGPACDAGRLAPLVDAGLSQARVLLPSAVPEEYAAWCRPRAPSDPRRLFAAVRAGIANMLAAGLQVELRHPVGCGNEGALPGVVKLAGELQAAEGRPLAGIIVEDPSPREGFDMARWHESRAEAEKLAASLGVRLMSAARALEPESAVGTGQERSPGSAAALEDGPERGEPPRRVRLLITSRCDQRCAFCDHERPRSGGRHVPFEVLEDYLRRAAGPAVERVVFTGGEPVLHPALPDLVALARNLGIPEREVQTNGVGLADGRLAAELAAGGLNRAQLSLHSADPALSDRVTGIAGSHQRTLEGGARLLAASVRLRVNCVIGRHNQEGLSDLVRLVKRWYGAAETFDGICFHTVRGDGDDPERWREWLAPFDELGDRLRAALDLCRSCGVPFSGPATAMGVPYCLLDGDERYLGPLEGPARPRVLMRERQWFCYLELCQGCRLKGVCPGIRTGYAALFGARGLKSL